MGAEFGTVYDTEENHIHLTVCDVVCSQLDIHGSVDFSLAPSLYAILSVVPYIVSD